MQICTNWFKNIVQPCRRVVPKYSVLNEGRICPTKILYWLIIWKLVCVLIVMDQEWSRSWNFLNKLIMEFLLSIFRSEALFGHPTNLGKFFLRCKIFWSLQGHAFLFSATIFKNFTFTTRFYLIFCHKTSNLSPNGHTNNFKINIFKANHYLVTNFENSNRRYLFSGS